MLNRYQDIPVKVALLDLDGTLYRGSESIAGASEFVQRLRNRGIQPVFYTNNASRRPEEVAIHLGDLGIHAKSEEVCTAAQAAAYAIHRKHGTGARVVYVGTEGFGAVLAAEGLVPQSVHQPGFDGNQVMAEAAAVGLDKSISYAKLAEFCRVVTRLGHFVLTNPDVRLPVEDGFLPGNGAIGAFVSCATDITPEITGKPELGFMNYAFMRYETTAAQTIIVGDYGPTDILAGRNAGVWSIHVNSGVTRRGTDSVAADEYFDSVADLYL